MRLNVILTSINVHAPFCYNAPNKANFIKTRLYDVRLNTIPPNILSYAAQQSVTKSIIAKRSFWSHFTALLKYDLDVQQTAL
jgi:hypothetical protein